MINTGILATIGSGIRSLVSFLIVLALLAAVGFAGFVGLATLGHHETHLICEGTSVAKYSDLDPISYPETRLGLTVEQSSWFVFWADEKQRIRYRMTAIVSDGADLNWSSSSLILSNLNDTFLMTEFDVEKPQIYFDNATGYATLVDPTGGGQIEFEGFCAPVDRPF